MKADTPTNFTDTLSFSDGKPGVAVFHMDDTRTDENNHVVRNTRFLQSVVHQKITEDDIINAMQPALKHQSVSINRIRRSACSTDTAFCCPISSEEVRLL